MSGVCVGGWMWGRNGVGKRSRFVFFSEQGHEERS